MPSTQHGQLTNKLVFYQLLRSGFVKLAVLLLVTTCKEIMSTFSRPNLDIPLVNDNDLNLNITLANMSALKAQNMYIYIYLVT